MNSGLGALVNIWQIDSKSLSSLLGLLLGLIFLVLALYAAKYGKVWNGYYGWFCKNKTPFVFWSETTCLFIGSIGFILYFGFSLLVK